MPLLPGLQADGRQGISTLLDGHKTIESCIASLGPALLQALCREQNNLEEFDPACVALVEHIQRNVAPATVQGVRLYAQMRDSVRLLPVGCDPIDRLLRGGLREGQVVELCGESASGKTQLCLSAAVLTALRSEQVVYVDTTNSFSTLRLAGLHSLHLAAGVLPQPPATLLQVLANILVLRPHTAHELLSGLDELANQMISMPDKSMQPRLLIIDSISAVVSPALGSRQHNHGRALLASLASRIRSFAKCCTCSVLLTNHVVGSGQPGVLKPALGENWRSQVHWRLELSNCGRTLRTATVLASPLGEAGQSALYGLCENGALQEPTQ